MQHLLPVTQLDANFAAVREHAHRHLASRWHPSLDGALRHSLQTFMRSEVESVFVFRQRTELLPAALRHFADERFVPDVEATRAYAERRADQWRVALMELLNRLATDWDAIISRFETSPSATVTAISPPLGDQHHNGRTVYKVTLSDGHALIYKPRSVETEDTFARFLAWFDERDCSPRLSACRVLPRTGYGWTQFVERRYCESTDETLTYYWRQGAFLTLFWMLKSGDAIADNVVVARDHPVWVDTECISMPDLPKVFPGHLAFPSWIRESLLTSGMVLYGGDPYGRLRNQTGLDLCCTEDRSHVFDMNGTLKACFISAVVDGFRGMYRWILDNEEARTLHAGPLALWMERPVRVLLRPTSLYAALVNLLVVDQSREDEVRAHITDILRFGDRPGVGPFPQEVVDAELKALEVGDIPYWSTSTTSRDLAEANGGYVSDLVTMTCMECIEQRAARMTVSDMELQSWLLQSFLSGSDLRRSTELTTRA
jgi:lantibiotic modifying enzyme